MENLNISEIRAVTDNATQAPWISEGTERTKDYYEINIPGSHEQGFPPVATSNADYNAAFIASARQWVPALCDEVEADRAEIAVLEKTLEKACEYLADTNASKTDWKEYFSKRAREETEK